MVEGSGFEVENFGWREAGVNALDVDGVQLLRIDVKRFRGGLVFKAHRLMYHPTLGSRVMQKKKKKKT